MFFYTFIAISFILLKTIIKDPDFFKPDINAKDRSGYTRLHYAVIEGNFEKVLNLIVVKGANINTQNLIGLSPLHSAVCLNKLNIAAFLIILGADTSLKNVSNQTYDHFLNDAGRSYLTKLVDKLRAELVKGSFENKTKETSYTTGTKVNIQYINGEAAKIIAQNINTKDLLNLVVSSIEEKKFNESSANTKERPKFGNHKLTVGILASCAIATALYTRKPKVLFNNNVTRSVFHSLGNVAKRTGLCI